MEDRIQINGVWYVRENTDTDNLELEKYMHNNVVTYQCMAYEDFDWVFQAQADSANDGELDLIEIENKVNGGKEMWDNLEFIRNFKPATYEFISDGDILTKEGAKLLYYFINEIKRKGWL